VTLPAIEAWSPESPALYTLRATLRSEGGDLDTRTESFGFRSIEAATAFLLLNGQPFYMRGALDQDYYPDGFGTPPSLELLEDQVRKAKAMGLNLLRCHIKVPDPATTRSPTAWAS
jgi:beta-galactosidase/beta-glucuronidase